MAAEFQQLKSDLLFEDHFCLVRRPNEEGHAERLLDYDLRNFLVPVLQVDSLRTLNEQLEAVCRCDLERQLRGQHLPKKDLLPEEQQQLFLPLPTQTFEAHRVAQAHADSLSLVRFDRNSYSVPTQYTHRQITVVGTMDEVREDQLVARHERDWSKEQFHYEPLHYLAPLEPKPGGFDRAKPFEEWAGVLPASRSCCMTSASDWSTRPASFSDRSTSRNVAPVPHASPIRDAICRARVSASCRILTGATLDRLTHRCHILEAGGESYRLRDAKTRQTKRSSNGNSKSK